MARSRAPPHRFISISVTRKTSNVARRRSARAYRHLVYRVARIAHRTAASARCVTSRALYYRQHAASTKYMPLARRIKISNAQQIKRMA